MNPRLNRINKKLRQCNYLIVLNFDVSLMYFWLNQQSDAHEEIGGLQLQLSCSFFLKGQMQQMTAAGLESDFRRAMPFEAAERSLRS